MSDPLLSTLVAASIRSAAVVAAAGALLTIFRVRDVRFMHRVWTAVMLAMLAMPILPWLVPAIELEMPSVAFESNRFLPNPDRALAVDSGYRQPPPSGSVAAVTTAAEPAPRPQAIGSPAPQAAGPAHQRTSDVSPAFSFEAIAVSAYVFVAGVLLLRLASGWLAARRVVHAGRLIDFASERPSIVPALAVPIIESRHAISPIVLGILRPVVVLPAGWSAWSDEMLRAVCAHELAHVRRRDPLIAFLARLTRVIFWFHPASWWLERRLGTLSEQACDDEAVARVRDANGYAGALLNVARAVHTHGRRLSWHAMGIAGDGSVSARIERVLEGVPPSPLSRMRTAIVCGALALSVLLAAACGQRTVVAAYSMSDEQERHELALRDSLNRIDERLGEPVAGRNTTPEPAALAELEKAVDQAPDDLTALDRLLIAYWHHFAVWAPDPKTGRFDALPVDEVLVAKRRQRILWLIAHHPESTLAGTLQARLFPEALAPFFPGDPEGYAQGKAAWEVVAGRPDVTSAMLDHAASFVERVDAPLAERLLLRARDLSPGETWSIRLGGFYADAITNNRQMARVGGTHVLLAGAANAPGAPIGMARRPTSLFPGIAKARLAATKDPILLIAAAWTFSISRNNASYNPATWARECYERALELAPQWVLPRSEIIRLKRHEAWGSEILFAGVPPDQEYAHVMRLPEDERLGGLADLAHEALRDLEALDRYHDPNLKARTDMDRTNAEQGSREALKLADRRRDNPDYGTAIYFANMTLGGLALRDGNKTEALSYLKMASHAPTSERLAYANGVVLGWDAPPLTKKLLAAGEREAVAGFLDQMATINLATRTSLRDTAAAIRRGENPRFDGPPY